MVMPQKCIPQLGDGERDGRPPHFIIKTFALKRERGTEKLK
jgi:hypothetical protein